MPDSLLPKVWILLVILSAFVTKYASAIEVLDYYPACDYELLDTVKKQRKIHLTNGNVTLKEKQLAAEALINSFKTRAEASGAEALLIVDSQVEKPTNNGGSNIGSRHYRLFMTVEFIKSCKAEYGRKAIATGFGTDGIKEAEISLAKIDGWEKSLQITKPVEKKIVRPPVSDFQVDMVSGIAGIKPGDSLQTVTDQFGTPTFEVFTRTGQQLVVYGRSLFFVFEEQVLSAISSYVDWFSPNFISVLPFDDRFDDQPFTVEDLNEGVKLDKDLLAGFKLHNGVWVKQSDTVSLALKIDHYHSKHSEHARATLTGFSLSKVGYQPDISFDFTSADRTYQGLDIWLNSRNEDGKLTAASLAAKPIGIGYLNSSNRLYLYSNHLLVEEKAGAVTKMQMLESVFNRQYTSTDMPWQYGDIVEGMSKQALLRSASGDVFELNETVEITTENTLQNLYFYPVGDELKLYSAEISVY